MVDAGIQHRHQHQEVGNLAEGEVGAEAVLALLVLATGAGCWASAGLTGTWYCCAIALPSPGPGAPESPQPRGSMGSKAAVRYHLIGPQVHRDTGTRNS